MMNVQSAMPLTCNKCNAATFYNDQAVGFTSELKLTLIIPIDAGIVALMYAAENKLFGINKNSSPLVFLTEDAI